MLPTISRPCPDIGLRYPTPLLNHPPTLCRWKIQIRKVLSADVIFVHTGMKQKHETVWRLDVVALQDPALERQRQRAGVPELDLVTEGLPPMPEGARTQPAARRGGGGGGSKKLGKSARAGVGANGGVPEDTDTEVESDGEADVEDSPVPRPTRPRRNKAQAQLAAAVAAEQGIDEGLLEQQHQQEHEQQAAAATTAMQVPYMASMPGELGPLPLGGAEGMAQLAGWLPQLPAGVAVDQLPAIALPQLPEGWTPGDPVPLPAGVDFSQLPVQTLTAEQMASLQQSFQQQSGLHMLHAMAMSGTLLPPTELEVPAPLPLDGMVYHAPLLHQLQQQQPQLQLQIQQLQLQEQQQTQQLQQPLQMQQHQEPPPQQQQQVEPVQQLQMQGHHQHQVQQAEVQEHAQLPAEQPPVLEIKLDIEQAAPGGGPGSGMPGQGGPGELAGLQPELLALQEAGVVEVPSGQPA